jgi:hypothetical protein
MANTDQHLITVDINEDTIDWLNDKLALGYLITHIVNLNPTYNKLLIVYCEPYQDS